MVNTVTKPDPDPTSATTAQLLREMEHQRELAETRFEAMDKAITLLQANVDKSPTIAVVDEKLEGIKNFFLEMFKSVQTQFSERDTRIDQSARTIETAINTALQSAEKSTTKQNENFAQSVDKTEKGFTKEIDGIKTLLYTSIKSLEDKISANASRITEINGHSQGMSDGWGYLVGAIGVLVAIGAFIINLIGKSP